ncbi:MAG: Coenzyme PQQ synthesis protein B [Mycoplasmataceae bacterium]|nr:MAG: Coenzyme PQQ synthesis protein B [Mycoplasmataceae bacterium]
MVAYDELEPSDWEEIVSLIEKRNQEREKIYEQKESVIKKILNNNSNLYYHFLKDKRTSIGFFTYPDKHGRYFSIQGVEKGREYYLNINANHPILNNFSWERNGYYLIKTDKKIERNDQFGRPWSDGGINNPNNFHKWVEINDKITITYYNVSEADLIESERNNHSSESPFVESQNKNSLNLNNLTWWIGVVVILSVAGIIIAMVIFNKKKKKK